MGIRLKHSDVELRIIGGNTNHPPFYIWKVTFAESPKLKENKAVISHQGKERFGLLLLFFLFSTVTVIYRACGRVERISPNV